MKKRKHQYFLGIKGRTGSLLLLLSCILALLLISGCQDSPGDREVRKELSRLHKEISTLSQKLVLMEPRDKLLPGKDVQITGEVAQTVYLSAKDLARFECSEVRLNEVSRDGRYHGAFYYRGPTLRSLLEFAGIKKKAPDFNKDLDLAIVVKDKKGQKIVVSWGEIFYQNPSNIIIAFEACPIIPHHEKSKIPKKYHSWLEQLEREVGFPKLVLACDFYSDRSLEGIASIEVVDLHPEVSQEKQEVLFAPQFTVSGYGVKSMSFDALPPINRTEILFKEVGDGQGYHGLKLFEGVSLAQLLEEAGIQPDLDSAIILSAPDGYRTLLSYGELFMSPAGKNIIIGDMMAREKVKRRGCFFLVTPDDLSADRQVKSVQKIEVISLR
ncbi:MAG: hypothetical protein JXB09_00835 [Deltaproteobacteria bacterium]|nr:hypothetical protein [Deltaproteobacteria bacterium]